MKPRQELREFPAAQDKECRIVKGTAGRYALMAGGELIAESDSPRWLSDCALKLSGAKSVEFPGGIPWDL